MYNSQNLALELALKLGVNIDHIAVLRQARKINDPDPIAALLPAKLGGADQITIHLREDRRHIHDDDAALIVRLSQLPVNIECSVDEQIIKTICRLKPHRATLVPEKREEVTTEGGLDLVAGNKKICEAIEILHSNDIAVSLFVDPKSEAMELSREFGADMVELHTGAYANLTLSLFSNLPCTQNAIEQHKTGRKRLENMMEQALKQIENSADLAKKLGLQVAAGHGLNYENVKPIATMRSIEELNIGQSIVARAVWVGFERAVAQMKEAIAI